MGRLRDDAGRDMTGIDSIRIEGFRSIRKLTLDLRPVNVLVGANGAGKSNILEAFSLLRAIRRGRLRLYVLERGGAARLLHVGTERTERIRLQIGFANGTNEYSIVLGIRDDDTLYPLEEFIRFEETRGSGQTTEVQLHGVRGEPGISEDVRSGPVRSLQGRLDRFRRYHFHHTGRGSPMLKHGGITDNRDLDEDGANLAPFLLRLRERYSATYTLIRDTIRLAAPFFDDFDLSPLPENEEMVRLRWRHQKADDEFDGAALSDGALRFIALTTLFLSPTELRPAVILVDEPELGLHPAAVTLLADLIRHASAGSQVIVATQSPTLLDHFDPEDAVVVERRNGSTTLDRKSPESLAPWLEEFSLGELWEKNEIGGRPQPERWPR